MVVWRLIELLSPSYFSLLTDEADHTKVKYPAVMAFNIVHHQH